MKGWNLDPIGLLLKRKMPLQIQSNFHWMSWKTALIKVKIEFFFPLQIYILREVKIELVEPKLLQSREYQSNRCQQI